MIAEDHATVRGAVRTLLECAPDIEVVGEASDGVEAVAMAKELNPDVILMDIAMPNLNGAQATRRVKSQVPKARVLVLTRHDDEGYLKRLLEEGADGYILKQGASSLLMGAIRQVAAGNSFLDPAMTRDVMAVLACRGNPKKGVLSSREKSVLRLTAWGHSVKEISVKLDLSLKTVETDKRNASGKLGISSRVEIVKYAIQQGWMRDN